MELGFEIYKDINFSLYYPVDTSHCSLPLHHSIPVKEIFYDKIYEKYFPIEETDVVLDLGSHIGTFAMRALGQGAQYVYCFEPEITYYKTLERNLLWYPKGKANINADYATSETIINLLINNHHKFNFWKIDIEGYEYDILEDKTVQLYLLQNANKIALEFHINGDEQISNRILKIYELFEAAGWKTVITDVNGMELTDHFRNNYWYADVNKHAKEFYNEVLGYLWKP